MNRKDEHVYFLMWRCSGWRARILLNRRGQGSRSPYVCNSQVHRLTIYIYIFISSFFFLIPCVLSLVLVHTTCMNVRIRQSVVGSICRRRSLIWLDPLSFPLSPGDSSRLLPTNTSRKRTIHLHLLAWHFIPPTCR